MIISLKRVIQLIPKAITLPNGSHYEISSILEVIPYEDLLGKFGIIFSVIAEDRKLEIYYNHRLNNWYIKES